MVSRKTHDALKQSRKRMTELHELARDAGKGPETDAEKRQLDTILETGTLLASALIDAAEAICHEIAAHRDAVS